ncbi:MAG: c-type cytochrome, partial [bacterium]|nr:c-type cytochrome [Candidatus Kapabacteria bacterium]
LPGRYTTVWFEATKPGTYHLFCAEYCGTQHSGMIGRIVVMEPTAYQAWLSGGDAGETPASAGKRLVTQLGCITCHSPVSGARGPAFEGLFGTVETLQGGGAVTVDEQYVHESIVNPRAQLVQGYAAIMPTYTGQITEEGILQIVAYLKSIGGTAALPADNAGAMDSESTTTDDTSTTDGTNATQGNR